ncbi:hypothetical protein [Streptomyces pactum]|uniref:hypothetical protein n=1 Tax=Streptomyces pactum TaxID=68249 RepID=UPI0037024A31
MLLTARLDTRTANEAFRTGALQQALKGALDQLNPEAAYFTTTGGRRTWLFFFDLRDPSRIPATCERFFLDLDAEVDLKPVMNVDDLAKGVAEMESG